MSAERLAKLSAEQWAVFFAEVGEQLFRSLPISVQCGHKHPQSTIKDYYRVDVDGHSPSALAVEFLVDFVGRPTVGQGERLVEKWLGVKSATDPFMFAFVAGIFKEDAK